MKTNEEIFYPEPKLYFGHKNKQEDFFTPILPIEKSIQKGMNPAGRGRY